MGVVLGQVTARRSGIGVPNALVTAFAVDNGGRATESARRRLGSVATSSNGSFKLRHDQAARDPSGTRLPWDLLLTVAAPDGADGTQHEAVLATAERPNASEMETVRIVVGDDRLAASGLDVNPRLPDPDELIRREAQVRELQEKLQNDSDNRMAEELRKVLSARDAAAKPFSVFMDRLSSVSSEDRVARPRGYVAPGASIIEANLKAIQDALSSTLPKARSATHAVLAKSTINDLKTRYGLEAIPADALESIVWPWKARNPLTLINLRPTQLMCQGPPDDDCVTLLEQGLDAEAAPHDEPPTNSQSAGATSESGAATNGSSSTGSGETPDVQTLVHHQVDSATSPEVPVSIAARPKLGDIEQNIEKFALKSGPADAPALYDFDRLHIAFEPVWHELFDQDMKDKAQQLYEGLVELGIDPNAYLGWGKGVKFGSSNGGAGGDPGTSTTGKTTKKAADKSKANLNEVIRAFEITDAQWTALNASQQQKLADLAAVVNGDMAPDSQAIKDAQANANNLAVVAQTLETWGSDIADPAAQAAQENADSLVSASVASARLQGYRMIEYAQTRIDSDSTFDQLHELLAALDKSMKEVYRFNVYAANNLERSVNFGIVVTYRQRWEPVTYQVGELVKTIPLAPKEIRRFTKKLVTRQSRSQKEVQNNLESRRTEASETARAETEIVQKARNKTNFDLSAEGGVSIAIAHASVKTGLQIEAERDSQETKKEFREAVFKAAAEYKAERTLTVESSDSFEATAEESGEISNPNDEIPVTYLFYQLQRRFHVSEHFRSVVPVVLVAQEFPKPNEIDEDWIVAHDWVLRRVLLDDSFVPALNYLSTKIVGDEVSLRFLYRHVIDQRRLVHSLEDQIITATKQATGRYTALELAMTQRAAAIAAQDSDDGADVSLGPAGLFKSASDFLSGSSGGNEADAAQVREDAARDAYERAEKKNRELQERLDRETTVLQTATDNYTKELSDHLNRKTQVERLRVHIKQNIFYYMQAIWSHEVPDQRYFRLRDVLVPRLQGKKTYSLEPDPDAIPLPPDFKKPYKITLKSEIDKKDITYDALGDVADLDNPLGFKGNYIIFPLLHRNDLTDFLMTPYYDPFSQASDPDPLGNWTLHDLVEYTCCERKMLTKEAFNRKLPGLIEAYKILKDRADANEELIVPTDSLYIEALPGAHPVLEDFKLLHRAIDVKKAQAEVRGAELENVRFAARLLSGEREDPTIEKKVIVEGDGGVVIADG